MRINLFAGPCVGKSTIAAYAFAQMKIKGFNIEHINEYVKVWAYEKRKLEGCDQFYIFAKQWRKEDILLRNGVDHIITDSPLLMQCMYAEKYGAEGAEEILTRALKLEEKMHPVYRTMNIFLERVNGTYQQKGRYQTEAEAIELDNYILNFLKEHNVAFTAMPNDAHLVSEYCMKDTYFVTHGG